MGHFATALGRDDARGWASRSPTPSEADAVATLVERWLRAFGPGTVADIKWWLGSTVRAVRRALEQVGAVEVDLDGRTGYLLADDLEPTEPAEPWAALLPPLDPTTMGWFERDWYLGEYKPQLFDSTGNGGPAVWWDGRIVGGWRQEAERRGRAAAARGRGRRRPARDRARGRAADRVVRRHAGAAAVPVAAVEGDRRRRSAGTTAVSGAPAPLTPDDQLRTIRIRRSTVRRRTPSEPRVSRTIVTRCGLPLRRLYAARLTLSVTVR